MRLEKAKRGLLVEFDWASKLWSATHRAYIRPALDELRRLRRCAIARGSFPNDLGNYRGKRMPMTACEPLSPRQRFARLAADYLAARMTYQNPPHRRHPFKRSLKALHEA